jgi:hypothetical protein
MRGDLTEPEGGRQRSQAKFDSMKISMFGGFGNKILAAAPVFSKKILKKHHGIRAMPVRLFFLCP